MFTCAVKVDIGVSEEHNDDRVLIGKNVISTGTFNQKIEDNYIIGAVCDGVGGLVQGYKAAEITLNFLTFLNRSGVNTETLRIAIEEANRRVRNYQKENNLVNGARTTISGIYADNDNFIVFNAGDSRVYRFRYKYLLRLTKDNSYVQDLIDLGEITPDEARNHPKRNVINKCIGNEEIVNAKISVLDGDFIQGDILAICSDGISDVLTNKDLQDLILQHKNDIDLTQCCENIYQKAIEQGSLDNLSILLIRKDG